MAKISIVQNSFGHLHIFKGLPKLNFNNKQNITKTDGTESEIYIQQDIDIINIKQNLNRRQIKDLNNGFRVVIEDIGFFTQKRMWNKWQ